MTVEKTMFVRVPPEMDVELENLRTKANDALLRSSKLPPGDNNEVDRFEALCSMIEKTAVALANAGGRFVMAGGESSTLAPSSLLDSRSLSKGDLRDRLPEAVCDWIDEGRLVAVCRLPHFFGETERAPAKEDGPGKAAAVWKSTAQDNYHAVTERFEFQIQNALTGARSGSAVLNPSGVSNQVLTETLRKYAGAKQGEARIDIPVVYRDGSSAEPFPLRAVDFSEAVPSNVLHLRFALLSIRHVEMDVLVDGSWFRNAKISKDRPAGLTDAVAFENSVKQLRMMRRHGPTLIEMYQTGLQPAIMGFYRAVVHSMIEAPGSVFVIPKFFRGHQNFEEGTVWSTN